MNYTHLNAHRISTEVARCLRYPADQLRAGLERSVESIRVQREDTVKVKRESEIARKYFGNLIRESAEGRRGVEAVDLEGAAPGMAGGYESGVLI